MDVDTIVALSTAPGVGAIAVVRMSGPDAFPFLRDVAPDVDELAPEARTATVMRVVDPDDGAVIDRALVTRFVAPDSYTGEDLVEISCHGGVLVPQLVLDACRSAGAREAEPGEFTRRAYLRGRMDLVQAEAVDDLIHARSRALHRTSVAQLERGLSARVGALRKQIVRLEALLAHHVDFPEEDDPPVPLERVRAEAGEVVRSVERMLSTAPEGELLREGALVVLAGRPNVGKSSLYNALLGRERAIVTEIAGTTRDAIEADVELGGFPFRLVDTAGLRETDQEIERLGIEVTRRYLESAEVVLFCVEAGGPMDAEERAFLDALEGRSVIVVETKADRVEGLGGQDGSGVEGGPEAVVGGRRHIRVSTVTGDGLDVLRAALPALVFSGLTRGAEDVPVITRRRHARALREAAEAVRAFGAALDHGVPPEVAAAHLRDAETALEDVLGVIATDDVLDVVFRDFCVGK
ncbi:MAG: tRNA uridine-5-carboxymethylaminomethyl(34) synthesis GTPase MnmE [Gemmatimonadota bacterium]